MQAVSKLALSLAEGGAVSRQSGVSTAPWITNHTAYHESRENLSRVSRRFAAFVIQRSVKPPYLRRLETGEPPVSRKQIGAGQAVR